MLGSINGSGRITLRDPLAPPEEPIPVDLDLEKVLGKMPNKTFKFQRQPESPGQPLSLPEVRACADLCSNLCPLSPHCPPLGSLAPVIHRWHHSSAF